MDDKRTPNRDSALASPRALPWLAAGCFLFARLVMLLALPLEGLRGFGDLPNFYQQAALPGWPYLDYWTEFPPVFPFLSALLYRVAGGQEHVYDYLLVFVLTLADTISLVLFWRLAERFHLRPLALVRAVVYGLLLVALPYHWWYFDPLGVLFLLAGLTALCAQKDLQATVFLGAGALVKFFPVLALVFAWNRLPQRRAVRITAGVVGMVALVYALLMVLSPQYTLAGLRSQGSKGSWETIWALVDGNYQTGNFGPYAERLDPATALVPRGNPARIPTWLTLAGFGLIGLWGLWKAKRGNSFASLSLIGLAWALMLLWSPGWSPQWCLYLLPLILLAFPLRLSLLLSAVLVLVNLLEWPVLLSRGMFQALPGPVLIRTLLLALMAAVFYFQARTGEMLHEG